MRDARTGILVLTVAILMASVGLADVFGPPTDDAAINMRDPDANAGSNDRMRVRNRIGHPSHPENWQSDGLVRFELSSTPRGSTVESATLYLYYFLYTDISPVGRDVSCFKIIDDWDESTVTWNTRPTLAPARTSGCIVPPTYGWMSWDVTMDVRAFVDGVAENHGWQLVDEVPFGGFDIPTVYLCSKEHGSWAPYLDIEWTQTPVVASTWSQIKALFR